MLALSLPSHFLARSFHTALEPVTTDNSCCSNIAPITLRIQCIEPFRHGSSKHARLIGRESLLFETQVFFPLLIVLIRILASIKDQASSNNIARPISRQEAARKDEEEQRQQQVSRLRKERAARRTNNRTLARATSKQREGRRRSFLIQPAIEDRSEENKSSDR